LAETFARLDGCGADAELILLARHCLEATAQQRPADAGAVAKLVAAYEELVRERLRQAEVARAEAAVRAEEQLHRARLKAEAERKRRRLQLALAATVMVLLCLIGGGAWWVQLQRLQQDRIDVAIDNALRQARELQTKAMWPQAHNTLQQALKLLGATGNEVLRTKVQTAQANLGLLEKLDRIRSEKMLVVHGRMDVASAPPAYAAAFREHGWDIPHGAEADLVARLAVSPLQPDLLAALDDWLIEEGDVQLQKRLCRITAQVQDQDWRADLPAILDHKEKLAALLARVPAGEMTFALLAGLCRNLERKGGSSVDVLRAAAQRHSVDFWLWFALGNAYGKRGPDFANEAASAYNVCLALRPQSTVVWNNLGNALRENGELDSARAAYQKAIDFDSNGNYALPHFGLGNVLSAQGELDEAIAAYREAIRIDRKFAQPRNNLGLALLRKGEVDKAIVVFNEAIEVDRGFAQPYYGLGVLHLVGGNLNDAATAFKQSYDRLEPKDRLHADAKKQLDHCQALLDLERKLPAVLQGETVPASELLVLAAHCGSYQFRYRQAAQLYARAFQADPALADEPGKDWRLHAAQCAVLAASGQGKEAIPLAEQDKEQLRAQALAWLRTEMDACKKRLQAKQPQEIVATAHLLNRWQQVSELAGVREEKQLARPAQEQQTMWRQLWADVAELLKVARACFREIMLIEGTLMRDKRVEEHKLPMSAGKTYMIDMESGTFDTYLLLKDAKGNILMVHDGIDSEGGTNHSRIIWRAREDGSYRIVATTFEQRRFGPYKLIVREFADAGK
jgi:serine/threonine-protein kinase